MSDLRRLLAEHQIADVLSEKEQNILRMAAKNKSMSGIASLYGYGSAADAERAVARIVEKVQAMSGGNGNVAPAGGGPTPPRPAAPPHDAPPQSSTPAPNVPSHKERVLAYLRDHSEADGNTMRKALQIPSGSSSNTFRDLVEAGEIDVLKVINGKTKVYRLRPARTPSWAPRPRPASDSQPTTVKPKPAVPDEDAWIERYVNRDLLIDQLEKTSEELENFEVRAEQLRGELEQLENLRSALVGVGVLAPS